MVNRTHLLIVLIAIAGAIGGFVAGGWLRAPSATRPSTAEPIVGTIAARLDLPDVTGKPGSLADWHGKLVLVNFWASWCAPCREEMPLLDRAQQRLAGRGLQVVGIASDDLTATRTFLGKHPVRYPILVDDPDSSTNGGRDVSLAYGNTRGVLPYTVLIGRDGRILARRSGNFSEKSLDAWLAPFL